MPFGLLFCLLACDEKSLRRSPLLLFSACFALPFFFSGLEETLLVPELFVRARLGKFGEGAVSSLEFVFFGCGFVGVKLESSRAVLCFAGEELLVDAGDEKKLLNWVCDGRFFTTSSSFESEEADEEDSTTVRFRRFAGGAIMAAVSCILNALN